MANYQKHLFICTNQRATDHPRGSCDRDGIGALQVAFKKELAAHGLTTEIRANKAGCLDQCEHGPVVVVYPEGVWYGGVTAADIPEIVESHIMGGRPVERIRLTDDCINTATCPHRA